MIHGTTNIKKLGVAVGKGEEKRGAIDIKGVKYEGFKEKISNEQRTLVGEAGDYVSTTLIYAENSNWRVEQVSRRNRKAILRKIIPL